MRDAYLAAKATEAYTLHHFCPPSCHLNDTLRDLKEFTDRAKTTLGLWVDTNTEMATCTRIRTLVRLVREAIAGLPDAHECAPPPIPRAPAPSGGLEPLDAHAQADGAALADVEPEEHRLASEAAPSAPLTDAASDAVAEVSSSPSESPAVTAVSVICEPYSPSTSTVVVEMVDESGSAARHPAAVGLATLQVPLSEAVAQAGDTSSMGAASGASGAAATPTGAPPAPASAPTALPLPQMADETECSGSGALCSPPASPPAETIASEAAPAESAVESDSQARPAAPATAAGPAAGAKRTRKSRDEDSDVMPGLIPVCGATPPVSPPVTRASARHRAEPARPPAEPPAKASGSKPAARTQKHTRGAVLREGGGGYCNLRSCMPRSLRGQARRRLQLRLRRPLLARASST